MGVRTTERATAHTTQPDAGSTEAVPSPRYVPLVVAVAFAAFVAWRGRTILAVVVVALATIVTFVPAVGRPFERAVRAVFGFLGHWLGRILFGAIDLLVVLPFWALGRIFRRDPLRAHHGRLRGSGFTAPPDEAYEAERPGRPFSKERAAPAGSRTTRALRAVPRWVGIIVLLIVANYLVGWAWDIAWGHGKDSQPAAADRILIVTKASDLKDVATHPDPRENLPTMRDKPWWKPYLRELQLLPAEFYPYLNTKPLPFQGDYFTIDSEWARGTWNPVLPDGETAPVVWFFGGSTMFGEGQRDAHTIPSEVSRLAEADGLPIKAVNYGQRGWVNWQEMLLYESRLSKAEHPPQFAVFYDGLNDKNVQTQKPVQDPSYYDLDQLAARATDDTSPDLSNSSLWSQVWDAYRQHSFLDKVVGKLSDEIRGTPAGAEPLPDQGSDDPTTCYREASGRNLCRPVDEVVRNTLAVYRRGRQLIEEMSRPAGVQPVFFWQPERGVQTVRTKLAAQIDAPTVDISHSLDGHQDVYIDGGHTNEDGARLVAAAQWKVLKPKIEAWYAAHGGAPH